jgi:hypothetical protein
MHDFQTEIFALDFSRHLPPLLAVHRVPVIWCWAAACFLVLLNWFGFHANLPTVNSTRLGPVGDPYTVSPSESGRCSFQNHATIYTIASTGAMLLYRAETRARDEIRPQLPSLVVRQILSLVRMLGTRHALGSHGF